MGCNCGNKSSVRREDRIVRTESAAPHVIQGGPIAAMKQYVEDLGWTNVGTCNCSPNMFKYHNTAFPNKEVRIGVTVDVMQICKIFGRDTKVMGQGNRTNYAQAYEHWITKLT